MHLLDGDGGINHIPPTSTACESGGPSPSTVSGSSSGSSSSISPALSDGASILPDTAALLTRTPRGLPSGADALIDKMRLRYRERGAAIHATRPPLPRRAYEISYPTNRYTSQPFHGPALSAGGATAVGYRDGAFINDTTSVIGNDDIEGRQFLAEFAGQRLEDKLIHIAALGYANMKQLSALSRSVAALQRSSALAVYKNALQLLTPFQQGSVKRCCLDSVLMLFSNKESTVRWAIENIWDRAEQLHLGPYTHDNPLKEAVEMLVPSYITDCREQLSEAAINSVMPESIIGLEDFASRFLLGYAIEGEEHMLNKENLAHFAVLRAVGEQFTTNRTEDDSTEEADEEFWISVDIMHGKYVSQFGPDPQAIGWNLFVSDVQCFRCLINAFRYVGGWTA
ncbi:hypothetical protein BV25DRAFT_1694680 [Artomyces pyxidatus]|uniref:Uncharacterized protein n=1 Tax=Artomyces pyxidatus TaxID=48021 RepID=A0ACB8TA94_9AGAM|nr:hypothetical protein BV25DRAFT_1694680 [Artomyces pyxidatus]